MSYLLIGYLCCMELEDFIRKNKDLFKWKNVEEVCGLPDSSLRSFISKRRNLPVSYYPKLIAFFKGFDVEFSTKEVTPKQAEKLLPMKSGDWKPSLRGYWTNGKISRIPIIKDGVRYYEP